MNQSVLFFVLAAVLAFFGVVPAHAAQTQNGNWTGAYVGAEVGSVSNSQSAATPGFSPTISPVYFGQELDIYSGFPGAFRTGQISPLATAFTGYQQQYGSLVVGLETDISGLPAEGSRSFTSQDIIAAHLTASGGTQWLYTARPRLGVVVGNAMIYGTAGLALGGTRISTTYDYIVHFGPMSAFQHSYGASTALRAGYVFGGGLEYALTDRLRLKAESSYYDLGVGDATASGIAYYHQGFPPVNRFTSAVPYHVRQRFDGIIARLGLGFRL